MRFKEWLVLDEALDPTKTYDKASDKWVPFDPNSIEIKNDRVDFSVEGEDFYASFSPTTITAKQVNTALGDQEFKGVSISFTGPRGFSLTGTSKNPTEVYANLAKAVYGYTSQRNPDFLTFGPANEKMNVPYKLLYDGFINKSYPLAHASGDQKYFVRRDIFEMMKDHFPKPRGEHEEEWSQRVKEIKGEKAKNRKPVGFLRKPPNEIPYSSEPEPSFGTDV